MATLMINMSYPWVDSEARGLRTGQGPEHLLVIIHHNCIIREISKHRQVATCNPVYISRNEILALCER